MSRMLVVANYGVLGKRAGASRGSEEEVAPAPDGETMIVDPCSARFVRDPSLHPGDAGGAAGAIYRFIGIDHDAGFPEDVVAAIAKEGDVAYHRYGYPTSKHVLHCVGFDFRTYASRELGGLALSREIATDVLTSVYEKLFALAAKMGKKKLRLVPISSSIFAGELRSQMPQITADAILDAIDRCFQVSDQTKRDYVDALEALELCVYVGAECADYTAAWSAALAARAFPRAS